MLPQAVNWLAADWNGDGPLDLSRLLIVVPTRQSGRRLREALAGHAATKRQAVFPPRVVAPETLVTLGIRAGVPLASRLESLLAWAEVFRSIDLEEFRDVFPVDPPARNFSWALRLAQEFTRLQATLGEAGLRLGEVTAKAGGGFPEAVRWGQLGELERRHTAQLGRLGRRETQSEKIAVACQPPPLPGVAKIILLATPDPLPLALTLLGAQARVLPVEVLVFAPVEEAERFDGWGRPAPASWSQRELVLRNFERCVHLCMDPGEQARRVAEAAQRYAEPEGVFGAGVADPEVLPLLENELHRRDIAVFNPEGSVFRDDGLYQLLAALSELAREPSFAALATLAQCPDFFAYLRARLGGDFSTARWLAGLDELRSRHLPADLDAARRHAPGLKKYPELVPALEVVASLLRRFSGETFAEDASAGLREIFSVRRLDLAREFDAEFEAAAAAWTDVLRECRDAAKAFPAVAPAEWWEIALRLFGDSPRPEEKKSGALELQGWLELLWEDAPHLAVAGLNDGRVPDAVVGDPFLPESLRQRLGLKTNAARFARDAYVLQALAACRATSGRLDLLLGKTSTVGDPLRPSRLLLRCADPSLADRVAFLFREPERVGANFSWTRAWRLTPPRVAPPTRVAVTALRTYLQCPFRFYLRHVLRMEPIDPSKDELDALDFGTLCHAALEKMGDPMWRDCTDPVALRDALLLEFDRRVRERYGENLTLPLVVQLESARQRLAKAAEVQAREREEGWVVQQVERKFSLEIAGLAISGKIDRIDRHLETGAVRLIDYKTSDTAVPPAEAHWRALRPGEIVPEWARFDLGNRPRVWADLQLPLYRQALAAEFPGGMVCGYFVLPKAVGETGLVWWEDDTREVQEAAARCATGACAAIGAGEFWPPNEAVRAQYDDFAPLFHHGVADSIAREELS